MTESINVLIVDDSLFVRQMFSKFLLSDPTINVVGTASDPFEAREKIKEQKPDVITLDVEMPKMDGLSFLEKIMSLRPMPVVMASSLTQKGADTTIRALEIGAVDYVTKPQNSAELSLIKHELISKVKYAAHANVLSHHRTLTESSNADRIISYNGTPRKWLIAIGASTGGVEALREVLLQMPHNCPPIVITQHMPEMFTKSFADRLNKLCLINVEEVADGTALKPGNAYIAPGSHHIVIHKPSHHFVCHLDDRPPVSSHKPSVDVMFESIASLEAQKIVAALLTGMGRDGAKGLLAIRQAGGQTIAQDEASSVVYGMPKAAIELNAAEQVVPLSKVAHTLLSRCNPSS